MAEETNKQSTAAAPSAPSAPRYAGGMAGGPRKRMGPRRKVCRLCAEKLQKIDYKQYQVLRSFMTDSGKILSRRITGTCARHQRQITTAIKRNRNMAILPYVIN